MTKEREDRARNHVAKILGDLFYVKEEVPGSWPVDGRNLRLDLLLRPNEKARSMGFDVDAFGIELKDPQSNESVKKYLDCVIQAYTYTLCEFDGMRPSFVLIYPQKEKFFEHDWKNKYSSSENEKPNRREMSIVGRLMQRANVGELLLTDEKIQIEFGGARFFDSVKGRSKVKGLGIKRQVGSQKY